VQGLLQIDDSQSIRIRLELWPRTPIGSHGSIIHFDNAVCDRDFRADDDIKQWLIGANPSIGHPPLELYK
jgi:hypothetical protein